MGSKEMENRHTRTDNHNTCFEYLYIVSHTLLQTLSTYNKTKKNILCGQNSAWVVLFLFLTLTCLQWKVYVIYTQIGFNNSV